MTGGRNCSRGDVVIAPIVYSNQFGKKRRPVLVLNQFGDDFLVCTISSNPVHREHFVPLTKGDMTTSGLRLPSIVHVPSISVIHEALVDYAIGKISGATFDRVREEFRALV